MLAVLAVSFATPAQCSEDPGARAVQQHQMMRQQQQDTLQLRMLQQQRGIESPPAGARERRERERLQLNQEQRQQQLHYRQSIEPVPRHSADDTGSARAKESLKRLEIQRQGEAQLQRFDSELKQRIESERVEKARGEVRAPEPPATLQ